MQIYRDNLIFIEIEESEIPWLKIFPIIKYRELSECDNITRDKLLDIMLLIEANMIKYYKPKKINIAMFGNYLPHFHIHVMARFQEDSYFPEPMWGEKQRDSKLNLPSFNKFVSIIKKILND
ncbi:MAG: HIT family protein [Sulfurospirillum sp.]|nr:HIT family protein [Sulfurospirillum sp.]MBL0703566.1 HIT family protein [Sulfurospirillum sp.]